MKCKNHVYVYTKEQFTYIINMTKKEMNMKLRKT